ncbi:SGNH/GDSL hydrolase family protein [Flavobacterium sp. ST-87]|uniref:SGNH/GDSL hydrolase family protein n=1 Tax=Flavobacterium plantiphilum TaxID=3163297 RepID=A0ABW8XUB0_9FLAO
MTTNKLRLILILSLFFSFFGYAQSLKSVSILGDSYSTFEGYMVPDTNFVWYNTRITQKTDVTSVKQTWWYPFIKDNNYKLEVNNSFSGSTICNTGYQKQDYSTRSFIRRMDNLGSPDVIFIFGATNDAWANAPIGQFKYKDWTKEELYDFRPAMAYMLDYMLGRYPNVKIYFLLNSDLKETINESVKTICKHYNIDCIELKNIDKKEGHPSIKGMEQISNQISDFLSKK